MPEVQKQSQKNIQGVRLEILSKTFPMLNFPQKFYEFWESKNYV